MKKNYVSKGDNNQGRAGEGGGGVFGVNRGRDIPLKGTHSYFLFKKVILAMEDFTTIRDLLHRVTLTLTLGITRITLDHQSRLKT